MRWDEDTISNHEERVSPWEIDFSASFPTLSIQNSPRIKKLRTSLPPGELHSGPINCSDLLLPGPHHSESNPGAQKDVLVSSPWNSYIPGTYIFYQTFLSYVYCFSFTCCLKICRTQFPMGLCGICKIR